MGFIMDLEDFRLILRNSGGDIWALIDAAISVATSDNYDEVLCRRDGIVEKLYAGPSADCPRCNINGVESISLAVSKERESTQQFENDGDEDELEKQPERRRFAAVDDENHDEDEDGDGDGDCDGDDEQRRILSIKEQIEDPLQSEESLVDLLQTLADMDITFKALKDTDIGRYVNRLRKHPSSDVRRLVKVLVRKWKDLVDE